MHSISPNFQYRTERVSPALVEGDPVDVAVVPDDEALVAACRKELPDETRSYQQLVLRYHPFAYQVGLRVLGVPEDAEEVAQDAMLQVFHKLSTFEERSSFRSWLYRIVINAARNRFAKNKVRKNAEITLAGETAVAEPSTAFLPHDRIQEALLRLDEAQRELVVMRYVSGLSLEEIASALQIGISAAKMRLYRAMEAFKAAWDACENDDDTGKEAQP